MANEGSEEAEASRLLDASSRVKFGDFFAQAGKKIQPWTRPSSPILNQIDWGALLIALGGGIGLGVAGNATYDLAKASVISFLRRGKADPAASLSRNEAYAIALWAIARSFRQAPDCTEERSARRDSLGQWIFVIVNKRYEYRVVIPPGRPDVNGVEVERRKIRRSH